MPYSENLQLLFIHIPKNAGKSLETALGIVTEEEQLRYQWRNLVSKIGKFLINNFADREVEKRLFGMLDYSFTAQHLTYQEILLLKLVHADRFEQIKKITIVRNPYSRAVSIFKHMGLSDYENNSDGFSAFLTEFFSGNHTRHNDLSFRRTQSDFIRDLRGDIRMDYILHFENLNNEYDDMIKTEGWNLPSLPHIGKQSVYVPDQSLYCETSRGIVAEIFAEDFEHFNYQI